MDTPLQRKSKTDTFTRKLKRNIQRTEPPILRMETGTILIVDDNKSVLASLELLLENVFSTVRTAANPNQITTILSTTPIDIVILDMNFSAGINNGNEGLYWLKHIHEIRPSLPVIMLTAYGDVELAVKALKNGATDFLLKPWDNHILIQKIKEAYQNNRPTHHKNSPKSTQKASGDENLNKSEMLIGHSPAMLQLIKVVTKVAKTEAKLLTVLQNRNITRIGSNKVIPVDIRLISATNKDIPEMIKEGLFREDLFYRINTIHLEIPPLRERGDDLLLFIDAFLHRFASKYQRPEMRMHEQTIEKLRSYHWPGNIRELQHTIEKAVILCESNVIRPKDILVKQTWKPQTVQAVPNLEEVERQAIETAILQNNGNLTAAAEQLGISRQTLYNKLKRFKP